MQNVHTLTIRVMTTYSVSFTSKHPHSLGGTLSHLKTATRHATPRAKQELDLKITYQKRCVLRAAQRVSP